MTAVNNNNDIIVSENNINTIISETIGITESGKWNIFITKILVNKLINLLTRLFQ